MPQTIMEQEYFEWMFQMVCRNRYTEEHPYRKLLSFLHDVEFTYVIPKDANRAEDGIDLRYRYAYENHLDDDEVLDTIVGPCSVLEMILALSIRCEESIMDDPSVGDRTGQWFWKMVVNLGLGSMTDSKFDLEEAESIISRFLNREYEPDGRGGLFTVRNCECDLRDVEIWVQMMWFLDGIT